MCNGPITRCIVNPEDWTTDAHQEGPSDGVLLPDSIGLSITDKPNVRAEIWALLFDGSDVAYSDAQRIINIEASDILNNGLELVGNTEKGYALYSTGTSEIVLKRAYRYFRQSYALIAERYINAENYTGMENYI